VTVSARRSSDLNQILTAGFDEHSRVVEKCVAVVARDFTVLVDACLSSLKDGGKIILFGNGGSAADAQHIATELTIRFEADRPAIAAIALTTDTSALTACGNDLGFERVFSRQVEALVRSGDVEIRMTTSGRSKNVLAGIVKANEIGAKTFGFTGETGGDMNALCTGVLRVPSKVTARIQEMHILLGHLLCQSMEMSLAPTSPSGCREALLPS